MKRMRYYYEEDGGADDSCHVLTDGWMPFTKKKKERRKRTKERKMIKSVRQHYRSSPASQSPLWALIPQFRSTMKPLRSFPISLFSLLSTTGDAATNSLETSSTRRLDCHLKLIMMKFHYPG
ncbi:unnamed protein product [Natator depressus]